QTLGGQGTFFERTDGSVQAARHVGRFEGRRRCFQLCEKRSAVEARSAMGGGATGTKNETRRLPCAKRRQRRARLSPSALEQGVPCSITHGKGCIQHDNGGRRAALQRGCCRSPPFGSSQSHRHGYKEKSPQHVENQAPKTQAGGVAPLALDDEGQRSKRLGP